MATGKTATGRALAKSLKRDFIDTDDLIVEREDMPIADIFKVKGESYFRAVEKDVVSGLSKKDGLVVACGGGTFVDPDNIRLMRSSGIVICLTSSPEMILKRTQNFTHRPLLNVEDPLKRIKELLDQRMPFYSQAHHMIDCDRLSVEESAREALRCLK